jgi:choline/glycine/proline betaine transport protein
MGFDVHPQVLPIACAVIALFIGLTLAFKSGSADAFGTGQTIISAGGGWFYILAVNVFILVILYFALSKYGSIRIGGVEANREFTTFSWMVMLFSAGMGIGLMFFSVAEPISHFGSVPPFFAGVESGTRAAGTAGMAMTYFRWGIRP